MMQSRGSLTCGFYVLLFMARKIHPSKLSIEGQSRKRKLIFAHKMMPSRTGSMHVANILLFAGNQNYGHVL